MDKDISKYLSAQNWIWESEYNLVEKVLMYVIIKIWSDQNYYGRVSEDGWFETTDDWISKKASLSRKTVNENKKFLIDEGFVKCIKGGRNTPSKYKIQWDRFNIELRLENYLMKKIDIITNGTESEKDEIVSNIYAKITKDNSIIAKVRDRVLYKNK